MRFETQVCRVSSFHTAAERRFMSCRMSAVIFTLRSVQSAEVFHGRRGDHQSALVNASLTASAWSVLLFLCFRGTLQVHTHNI